MNEVLYYMFYVGVAYRVVKICLCIGLSAMRRSCEISKQNSTLLEYVMYCGHKKNVHSY